MLDLRLALAPHLDAEGTAWLAKAEAALADKGTKHLLILLPQLARTLGREHLTGAPRHEDADGIVDVAAYRRCDIAGALLMQLADLDDDLVRDAYWHGDMEEKTIVLRSLALRPITQATVDLLGEIQRTNTGVHFEAGGLDHDLIVRATLAGGTASGFTQDDFHRFVLKMAFMDMPLERLLRGLECATPELSRMLQDFATEREAAGRAVWVDTWRFIGGAPGEGTLARVIGGLEHGSDPVRFAAAQAALTMRDANLAPFARERLAREPVAEIRDLLEKVAAL